VSRVAARAVAPGTVEQAEALWFDLARWPAFVDGFATVARRDDEWPRAGTLIWESTPHGRGRVLERVREHEPGRGQVADVEDERLRGVQTVSFHPVEGGVALALELDYALKQRNPLTPLVDLVFVRRAVGDALQRTATRWARERRGDAELL
jgi:hypothetical protein